MKKILITSLLAFTACSSNMEKNNQLDKVSSASNSEIKTPLKANLNFKIKGNPELLAYVKSVKAILSNSATDPFSNVFTDGSFFTTDLVNNTITFTFNSVPPGGPYYVYLAAYDGIFTLPTKISLAIDDNTLISTDKKWSRSLNTLNISPTGVVTFSDNGTSLKVTLKIKANNTGININPVNGSNTPTNVITVIKN